MFVDGTLQPNDNEVRSFHETNQEVFQEEPRMSSISFGDADEAIRKEVEQESMKQRENNGNDALFSPSIVGNDFDSSPRSPDLLHVDEAADQSPGFSSLGSLQLEYKPVQDSTIPSKPILDTPPTTSEEPSMRIP